MSSKIKQKLDKKKKKSSKQKKLDKTYFEGDDPDALLPKLFIECINFLEENALDEEGILRVSGRIIETQTIKGLLLDGRRTNLGQVDVHAVASTLKAYLCDSPTSLLPENRYSLFLKVADDDNPESLILLRELIANMPLSSQRVLHRLMIFVHKVLDHTENNKMTVQSISIILGPAILRTSEKQSAGQLVTDNSSLIKLAEKIIRNTPTLFEGIGLSLPYTPNPLNRPKTLQHDVSKIFKHESSKDKVKARFFLQFSLHCEPHIKGTQSLFIKCTKGRKTESHKTKHIVCTDPSDVSWDDTIALDCTLFQSKKNKQFDEKNISLSVKEVSDKGTKTLGSTICDLAEMIDPDLPRTYSHTYILISKVHKGMKLRVNCQSECLKINSQILVKGNYPNLDTDEDDYGESDMESSFENDEEDPFDQPDEETTTTPRQPEFLSPDVATLRRVPSTSTIKSNNNRQKKNESSHSTLALTRVASARMGNFANARKAESAEKLTAELAEKDLIIAQLHKQIEHLSSVSDDDRGSKDNDVMQLRLDLLQNTIYGPTSLNFSYDASGNCFSLSAIKIIQNITKADLLYGNAYEKNVVLERVICCLQKSARKDSVAPPMYWLSTVCALLHSISELVHLSPNKEVDPRVVGLKALSYKVTPIAGLENIIGFVTSIQKLAVELYEEFIFLVGKQVDPLLFTTFLGKSATSSPASPLLKSPKTPKSAAETAPDIKDLKAFLETLLDSLLENKLFPVLAGDILLQVFDYIDEATFNCVIRQKKLFSADGVRLKIASLQIEHWLKDSRAEVWITKRSVTVLKHVQEVANLIMVDKEKLENFDFITVAFKNLNLRQILHVVENFSMEESSKKAVPASVIKYLTNLLKISNDKNFPLLLQGALNSRVTPLQP